MKQTMPILLLLIFFAGCGGGGGEYYPPLVDLNPFGIKKEPFTYSDVGQNEKIEIAGLERDGLKTAPPGYGRRYTLFSHAFCEI